MSGRPAISSAIRTGSQSQRYSRGFQTGSAVVRNPRGYSFVKGRAAASGNPIVGGVGSQSLPPRGVQPGFGGTGNLPPGGFSNTGGAGGSPQTGGGQVAKSQNPNSGQRTSGTSKTNPYGRTLPPGNSPNDALTKALLQSILNDRKKGEEAVRRNKDTGKVEGIDTAKLNERTKEEISKLSEQFKEDTKKLEESIRSFQKNLDPENNAKDKELNSLLDNVLDKAKGDSLDPTSDFYNPQDFIDAADKLDKWITDNPDESQRHGQELTDINEQVQNLSNNAKEQIAVAENNGATSFRASDEASTIATEESAKLKTQLDENSANLSEEDKAKVEAFQTQLDATVESINPGEKSFNTEEAAENIAALKKAYSELPEELRSNPEIADSYKRVENFSSNSTDSQILARTLEPDSAKFEQGATELVKGPDRLDADLAEYLTPEQRESFVENAVDNPELIQRLKTEESQKPSEEQQPSTIQPETSSPEADRVNNLGAEFSDDALDNVNQFLENQTEEAPRSDSGALDLELDSTDESIDDLLEDIDLEEDISEDIEEILEEDLDLDVE